MKAFFALLMFASVAHANPEFVGLVGMQNDLLFAVSPGPGRPPQWTRVGATIDGYLVFEYRSKEQLLVLKKDAEVSLLKLKTAKVRDLPVAPPAGADPRKDEGLNVVDKRAAAEKRIRELQAELANLRRAGDAKSKK